jgi:hypothetical protein
MKRLPILCLVLSVQGLFGQNLFNRIYPKPYWDYATAVIETDSNTYLIAASSESQNGSSYDILLMNINTQGDVIWEKYIGEDNITECANSISKTSDGGYIIGGYIEQQLASYTYVLKLNQNFNKLWSQSLSSSGDSESGYAVIENKDGEYIAVGGSYDFTSLYNLSSTGNINWTKHYQDVNLTSVIQTADDGYALAGIDYAALAQIVLMKTGEAGDSLWTKQYGGPGDDVAHSLVETDDQGFLVAGSYDSQMPDMDRWIYLVRTNQVGDTLWTNLHAYDEGTSFHIAKTSDHCYVLSASSWAYGWPNDFYTLKIEKISADGENEWQAGFLHRGITSVGNSVLQVSDGGYVLTGNTNNGDWSQTDVVLIKLDSLGNYVMGYGSNPFVSENIIAVFPLPAHDRVTVQATDQQHPIKTIEIHTSSGSLAGKFSFEPPTCEAELITSSYSPGLYLMKIITRDDAILTRKFIVVR